MRWRLTILDKGQNTPPASVIVEGNDWFAAFEAGLKKQPPGEGLVGNLGCVLHPGRILNIIDNLSLRSYDLRPVEVADSALPQSTSMMRAG